MITIDNIYETILKIQIDIQRAKDALDFESNPHMALNNIMRVREKSQNVLELLTHQIEQTNK